MKTYTIKEIKEQGIIVKCSGADARKLSIALGSNYGGVFGLFEYYKFNPNNRHFVTGIESYEIEGKSYIEFSQIDWEERKQIGWELKKDCKQYREAALKICGITHFLIHNDNGFFTSCKEEEILRKAGVLELWFEPVYEEVKFKTNDWVTYEGSHHKSTQKIKELTKDGAIDINGYFMQLDLPEYRHATAEEIKAAEKIKIGGHPVEFRNGTTEIDGFEFSKADWEAALRVSLNPKAKIKVGRSHQFDLPTETIERILSKLK